MVLITLTKSNMIRAMLFDKKSVDHQPQKRIQCDLLVDNLPHHCRLEMLSEGLRFAIAVKAASNIWGWFASTVIHNIISHPKYVECMKRYFSPFTSKYHQILCDLIFRITLGDTS